MRIFRFGRRKRADLAPALALFRDGQAAFHAGRLADAERAFGNAIELCTNAGPSGDALSGQCLNVLSRVHGKARRFEAAQSALDAAVEIIVRRGWQNTAAHANLLNNHAVLRWDQGKRDESLRVLEHCHATFAPIARSAQDHAALAGILGNLVGFHVATGNHEAARRWFGLAGSHCRSRPKELLSARATLIQHRLALWIVTGKPPAGIADIRRDVDDFQQLAGTGHKLYGRAQSVLGMALARAGETAEAVPILESALGHLAGHPDAGNRAERAEICAEIGMLHLSCGRYPEAEGWFRRAIELEGKTDADVPVRYGIRLNNLGVALREQGRLDEAGTILEEAIIRLENAFGRVHFHPANAIKNLGQVHQLSGHNDDAVASYREALRRLGESPPAPEVSAKIAETTALLQAVGAG